MSEAHRSKIKVAVHASTTESIALAIEAGVDSIEHAEEASDDQLRAMRDKGIFPGATELTRQALFTPFDALFKFSPQELAGFDAYFKNYSEKSTRRLQRARELGVRIAAGSDMWFQYPGKTRGESHVDDDDYRTAQRRHAPGRHHPRNDELEHVKFVMTGGQVVKNEWSRIH